MTERQYQAKLVKVLLKLIPGCEVIVTDGNYIQGIPDLLILAPNGKWAVLEVKKSENAKLQPNQEWYVNAWGQKAAFGSFIYPENEKEVLFALQQSLESRR